MTQPSPDCHSSDEMGQSQNDVVEVPAPAPKPIKAINPAPEEEIWRTWKQPSEAIEWASGKLPKLTTEALQAEFDNLQPGSDGKKARVWFEWVMEMVEEDF